MKYRSGKETEKKIINILLQKKEYAQYDLPKAVGKDYRTVLRHLKALEESGMIFLTRKEKSQKGGKDKKFFGLTFKGVINSLLNPENHKKLPEIISKYPYWCLTFKKWKLFQETGLDEFLLPHIELGLLNILEVLVYSQKLLNKKFLITKETHKLFDTMFLFVPLQTTKNKKLAQVLQSDPDLRKFIDEMFRQQLNDFEDLQKSKNLWDSLESS